MYSIKDIYNPSFRNSPKITGIYAIFSPSNKVYIGQALNIRHRWLYYNRLDCKQQKKLYSSLKKYGVENHYFQILIETEIDNLNKFERNFYDFFKNSGYEMLNLTVPKGENLKGRRDKSSIKRGKDHHQYQKSPSEETKRKISETLKGRFKGKDNPNYGKKLTQEQKERLSGINRYSGCLYKQMEPYTKEIVKIADGLTFDELGFNRTHILSVSKGKRKTHKGYIFTLFDKEVDWSLYNKQDYTYILQIDIETNLVISKNTLKFFIKNGFDQTKILNCCEAISDTHKGFRWKWEGEENKKYISTKRIIQQIDKNTNEIISENYMSYYIKLGFNDKSIYDAIKKNKTLYSFKWRYKP